MGLVVYTDSNDGSGIGRLRMYNSTGERFDAIFQWNTKNEIELLSVHPVGEPLKQLCAYMTDTSYWPEEHLAAILDRVLSPGYEPGVIDFVGVAFMEHYQFCEKFVDAFRNHPAQYGIENMTLDEIPEDSGAEVLEDGRLRLYVNLPKGVIEHVVDSDNWHWRDSKTRLNA